MKVRPTGDRLLIRRIDVDEKVGSLFVPDVAKEQPDQGEVISVGRGSVNERGEVVPTEARPGDKVLFGKYAGNDIKIEGQRYLIVRDDEILAIIEKDNEVNSQVAS